MTFEEILDQALAMLQRRGRVTYRALKLQFSLDDDHLEALKDELLYAHPQVVDDDGQGLIWTGGQTRVVVTDSRGAEPAEATGEMISPPPEGPEPSPELPPLCDTAVQSAIASSDAVPSPPTAPVPPVPEAERRQLTVLFCDLVDSTVLASQLDPEEWREVVRAYQDTCATVIQRYDGHVAQYLGDGLLIYFGYPQAHEDDAQRAVRTGLGMVEAIGKLNAQLQQGTGIQLAIRVGIHTGLVVVGEMGGGGRQEQLALGDTPNIAARLQGLAAPNTVVLSAATRRLVEAYFTYAELGPQPLKGVATPLAVSQVLGESGVQSRLDAATPRGFTPLVGREQEVGLLLERWAHVKDGRGQVVVLSGEAGIGKSRLVQVLQERASGEGATYMTFRCSPYHTNSALYPLIEHLEQLLQFRRDDTPQDKVAKLERALGTYRLPQAEVVPLLAVLLSLPHPQRYAVLSLSPQQQRQKTHEALVAWLLEETERQPVLAVWEDLHWADPSTLDLLGLVIDQAPTARLLTLLTCRPEFRPPWTTHSYVMQLTLSRLGHSQVEVMITRLTGGKALPAEVVQQIVEKTDGVPLFVEELTKAVLESEVLRETDGRYELTSPLPTLAIPTTLQDSLMARLDRLVTAKGLAQLSATLGRQFTYELLQAVASLDEPTLRRELERLVQAELLYQRGLPPRAMYAFKHALIQEIASQSLLKRTRQQYHQRIAQVLEERFPEVAETQPELVARHYTEAGLNEPAIVYWRRAAQRAVERSAHLEAISHLTTALALLKTAPDSPERTRQELDLQTALGLALVATKGFAAPEVAKAYGRARELCREGGEPRQLFQVLRGLWEFYDLRAQMPTARELAEQLLALAQRVQDTALLLVAHEVLGETVLWLGEFALARHHAEQAMALYDRRQHHTLAFLYGGYDPGVHCCSFLAHALWYLGYPDQALRKIQGALPLGQESVHPHSRVFALVHAAFLHHLRREGEAALARAEEGLAFATEQGFVFWAAYATILRGRGVVELEPGEEAVAQIRQGLAGYRETGAQLECPYFVALLAEALGTIGHSEEGLTVLAEMLSEVDITGLRFHEAELRRLTGECLLRRAMRDETRAEACFHQALEIARRQQAKSLELRASMSLSRLWQHQGKRDKARELLAPIYGWFTEGFDTADLQEAKALLTEVSR
jgi:class 3 adenylate cyclase/predicted ATPase